MFSRGSFCSSCGWSTSGVRVTVTEVEEMAGEEEVAGKKEGVEESWEGRNTITVLPAVVTNWSKPNTVLVSIPAIINQSYSDL